MTPNAQKGTYKHIFRFLNNEILQNMFFLLNDLSQTYHLNTFENMSKWKYQWDHWEHQKKNVHQCHDVFMSTESVFSEMVIQTLVGTVFAHSASYIYKESGQIKVLMH